MNINLILYFIMFLGSFVLLRMHYKKQFKESNWVDILLTLLVSAVPFAGLLVWVALELSELKIPKPPKWL